MRVLHLTTHLNTGGITTYIQRLIKPLQELGTEIQVLSSGGEMSSEFVKRGAKLHELPIRTKSELHPKLYFALPQIIKIIREEKIDLLHAHTRITQVMASLIQKIIPIPVVTTCHGFYKTRLGRKIFPSWGNRVIAISDGVADALIQQFKLPNEKVSIIFNAVNIEELDHAYSLHSPAATKKNFGFELTDPIIGIIARVVEDKGHRYLIEALPVLQKIFPQIRLLIVGEGRDKKFLIERTQQLKIEKHVFFTGNMPDVTKALAAMDVFILPATWREGFGLSIIEAMTCRKPVIVTNIWALNTLIRDRVTGLIIEPSTIDPIVTSVTELLTNPSLKESIVTTGRQMVEKLFSIDRMAREISDTYHQVLNR